MSSSTVNISFNKDLLEQIDAAAKAESRSRSELLREAARFYIERKSRWAKIFDYGTAVAAEKRIAEDDVLAEIKAHRNSVKRYDFRSF